MIFDVCYNAVVNLFFDFHWFKSWHDLTPTGSFSHDQSQL